MRPGEHVALPPQRNNLYIAVAAFVFMLLLGLFAAFFRLRLQLERNDSMDVRSSLSGRRQRRDSSRMRAASVKSSSVMPPASCVCRAMCTVP